jgi:hypothetical protein
MGWGTAFVAGYILGGISGLVVFGFLFGTRKEGEAEAEVEHLRDQLDAKEADQERADDIERKADEVRRMPPGDQPLAERLRAAGRGRATKG